MKDQITTPTPLLGIVVPVSRMSGRLQNLEGWLKSAIDLGIEIVIVHDWREQETEEDLLRIIKPIKSNFLKFCSGKFGSPGEARNKGLGLGTSTWISYWDSDDMPNVENFMNMVSRAESSGFDFAVGEFEVCQSDSRLITHSSKSEKRAKDRIESDLILNPGLWRWSFRRLSVEGVFFTDLRMAEDQLYLLETGAFQAPKYRHNELVYTYFRGHVGQLSSNKMAISELAKALRFLSIKIIGESNNRLTQILLLRLSITSVLHGGFPGAHQAIRINWGLIRDSSWATRSSYLKVILSFLPKIVVTRL